MGGKNTKSRSALGQQLCARRKVLGWSQREAADKIGCVSFPYLCQIEKDKILSVGLVVAIAISKAYDIPIEQIAAWSEQPHVERPRCQCCGRELD